MIFFDDIDSCPAETEFINMASDEVTYLTSPKYPNVYLPSTKCIWIFQGVDEGAFLMRFFYLYLSSSVMPSKNDTLEIGTGHHVSNETVVIELKLYFPNTLSVNGSSMWIRFTSADAYGCCGFFIEIERTQTYGKYCLNLAM